MMKAQPTIMHNYRFVLFLGWGFILIPLLLNIWVVEFLFVPDAELEWPNTFYVYLFQILVGIIGVICLIIQATHDAIQRYFFQTEIKKLALHAFLFLFSIDILLQILFLVTVNHPGDSDLGFLYWLFHLNIEKNVPSTYSALQLILSGVAALYCMKMAGRCHDSLKQLKYTWLCVAIVLFFLGADEYFSFHEDAEFLLVKLNLISSGYDNELGGFGYAWTLVGGFFFVVIGFSFSIFFFKIFSNYRYLLSLLFLSGGIFVLGAIGMEKFRPVRTIIS